MHNSIHSYKLCILDAFSWEMLLEECRKVAPLKPRCGAATIFRSNLTQIILAVGDLPRTFLRKQVNVDHLAGFHPSFAEAQAIETAAPIDSVEDKRLPWENNTRAVRKVPPGTIQSKRRESRQQRRKWAEPSFDPGTAGEWPGCPVRLGRTSSRL